MTPHEAAARLRRDLYRLGRARNRLRRALNQVSFSPYQQEIIMADFTAADAALASLQSTAAEVVTEFQAATANNDQPAVDSLTSGIQGVQSQLAALVPAPAAPAEPPAS